MKLALVLVGLVTLLSASSTFAQSKSQESYKNLVAARTFAVGGIGRGGAISSTEKDLWVLLQSKDEKSLLALTRERNPVARMYGLVGLQYLGSSQIKSVMNSVAKTPGKLQIISGCIVHEEPIAATASQAAKGFYSESLKYDMEHRQKQ